MPNLFKKLAGGARKFFNKVGHDTDKFFRKDVVNAAQKVGGAFEDAGRQTLEGLKKTGNFLEKNAGIIGDVAGAGLMASGFGAPLGLAVMAGGNVAQQAGTDLKNATSRVRQAANAIGSQVRADANQFGADVKSSARNLQRQANTAIRNNVDALNSNVGIARQQANQAISNAMANAKAQTNSLIDQASNQLNSAKFV